MTLEDQIIHVRSLSRTTESSHSHNVIGQWINEGQREFAKEAIGFWKDNYLSLDPKFDIKPNFYFKVTLATASASFPINASSSVFVDISGASVAAFIASSIQGTWAAATCNWSTADWRFTVEIPGESSIEVGSPEGTVLVDATDMFFGGGDTQTTATWLSSFPRDCTVKASLPTSFMSIEHVEWDNATCVAAPFDNFISPDYIGDPYYYAVKNKDLYLFPVPDEQKLLRVFYRAFPTDFGAASVTGSGSMSASSSLDAEVQMAPVFYAASMMAEQNFESKVADRMFARFKKMALEYKQNFHNQNPQMFNNMSADRLWYRVET